VVYFTHNTSGTGEGTPMINDFYIISDFGVRTVIIKYDGIVFSHQ